MGDKELQEARNGVKEANLLEENMTAQEIKQTYRAILLSRRSNEEDNQKKLSDSFSLDADNDSDNTEQDIHSLAEELCNPSTLRLQKKEADVQNKKGDNKLNGLDNSNLLDATKVKFGYLDLLPMSKFTVQLSHHQPKFVAIQHTEQFCNADLATKARMLSWHWSKISKAKTKQVQSSAIKKSRSYFCTMSITTTSDEEVDDNSKETYISRSGRHTKRKCYADYNEDGYDANTTPKKSKFNEPALLSNNNNNNNDILSSESKVKLAIKKSMSTPTKDIEQGSKDVNVSRKLDWTPVLTPLEEENDQNEEYVDVEYEDPSDLLADNESTKANSIVRSSSKKMSNDEIMKRSRLFEKPTNRKRRSDEIFDKLIEDREKKKREEKVIEKFEKSIDSTIEDDEQEPTNAINEVSVVYPRRVTPPVPRKGIASRATKISAAVSTSNQQMNGNTSQDPEVSSSSRAATRRKHAPTRDDDKIEIAPSTSKVDTSKFTDCPICQESFHVELIVRHASTCGDDNSSSPATTRPKRVECEICGGRFPLGDRYNIHVTDCLRVRQQQEEESQQLISRFKNTSLKKTQ